MDEETEWVIVFENGCEFGIIAKNEKEAVKFAYDQLENITGLPKNKIVRVTKVILGKQKHEQSVGSP